MIGPWSTYAGILAPTAGAGSSRRSERPRPGAIALLAAVTLAVTASAGAAQAAPPPVIRTIVVGASSLDIQGENLDLGDDPTVRLGTVVLAVQTSSAERVVAQLPAGIAAGSQRLRVRRSDGLVAKAMIEIGVVRQTSPIALGGGAEPIPGNATDYVFVGGVDGSVAVNVRAGQKIVGAGSVVLGLEAGSAPQRFDVGLCYKAALFGGLVNFSAYNYTRPLATTAQTLYPVSATVTLAEPGAYRVGICVRNNSGSAALSQNDYYNGWVMVVD